jgi:hypothetical protein
MQTKEREQKHTKAGRKFFVFTGWSLPRVVLLLPLSNFVTCSLPPSIPSSSVSPLDRKKNAAWTKENKNQHEKEDKRKVVVVVVETEQSGRTHQQQQKKVTRKKDRGFGASDVEGKKPRIRHGIGKGKAGGNHGGVWENGATTTKRKDEKYELVTRRNLQ